MLTACLAAKHVGVLAMNLDDWAAKWNIPAAALYDLRTQMGVGTGMPIVKEVGNPGSEARQQSLVRLDAAYNRIWLTRNNVGALLDKRGVPVRFGLANESEAQNDVVKSADLIGMRTILIGSEHLGRTIAQFVSREVKEEGWVYGETKHEKAQMNWCNFVLSKGGDAAFCTGPGSFNPMR